MYEIDNIDLKIVDLLMENGRMPSAEIARRMGDISERAVRYRINRLVQGKVIQVSAITDPRSLGYSVTADVWLEVDSDSILDVARKMTEFECVSYVACSIGETDVSVQVVGHNTDEIYRFITEVVGKIPGVRKTKTYIVPIVLKDIFQWRIPISSYNK
jgi:Lrp/AsnC family transcriptional regulator for asnA, asnC and gidA